MKRTKKLLSLVLVGLLSFLMTTNAFASETISSKADDIIQEIVNSEGLDATVMLVSENEYDTIWNQHLLNEQGTSALQNQLNADGFSETVEMDKTAVKIIDNENSDLVMYYFFKFYHNGSNEKVVAMFLYSPNASGVFEIWSQRINTDNEASTYYSYITSIQPITRDFNTISFLCSLGSIVACGSFSAMLFAFLPASMAVGLACEAAFAYVCAYT